MFDLNCDSIKQLRLQSGRAKINRTLYDTMGKYSDLRDITSEMSKIT
jgi:hypothetical protein